MYGGGTTESETTTTLEREVVREKMNIYAHSHPEIEMRLDQLTEKVDRIDTTLKELKEALGSSPVRVMLVEGKEVTLEKAKELVMQHMKADSPLYPSDVADTLGLDLEIIVEAFQALEREGRIRKAASQG